MLTYPAHNSKMIDYGRGLDAILGECSRKFYRRDVLLFVSSHGKFFGNFSNNSKKTS